MNLSNSDPNFSIVVPGACNARCAFCFWKESNGTMTKQEYFKALTTTLAALPAEFRQCSITGGEPTASTYLRDILPHVHARFGKVVLSSNGFDIRDEMFDFVNHLNISRHHWNDNLNCNQFGSQSVPNTALLQSICTMANEHGVDVTLNCVVPATFSDVSFVNRYLDFAKSVGANAVCFRKEHGTLENLPVEALIRERVIRTGGCPACRTKVRLMQGMQVTWRYGVLEPIKVMPKGEIYELVFQQDGRLTADWDGIRVVTNRDLCAKAVVKQSPAKPDNQLSCTGKPYLAQDKSCHTDYGRLVTPVTPLVSIPNSSGSGCGGGFGGC